MSQGLIARVHAPRVEVDEQWLKIRGRWQYGCVVVEVPPELPVLAAFRPSRRQGACRWIGRPLRGIKQVPRGSSTDGLPASAYLVPAATHVWCRFHPQQGVTPWRKPPFATDAEIDARTPVMKRRMPLYRLINDPFRALQERASVKATATMADVLLPQETVA